MKNFPLILLIIVSFSVSGQEEISKGLLINEIKDSVFQNLLISNNLIQEQNIENIESFQKEWKVSFVVVCPQEDRDTLYVVFKEYSSTFMVTDCRTKGNYFLFDKYGKHVRFYENKSWLKGYLLDMNFDGKFEIIDSYLIKTGKPCKGKLLNYLYIIPIKKESASTFGIVFYPSWHWKVIDLNNDNLFEIQIGPKTNKVSASFCHNSEVVINPKVTFYWSIEENKYYTTDTEYKAAYRILDFEILENCKKSERKFHRILHKF